MADRPIIFSAPMVRALIDGCKTQTRRVLKPQPDKGRTAFVQLAPDGRNYPVVERRHPYGDQMMAKPTAAIGDRLWVRETFNVFQFSQDGDDAWPVKIPTLEDCKDADELAHRYGAPQIVYRESDRARKWFTDQKWRPSIHMPRWASRLTLIVNDVRVQRLQEISEADAIAEGFKPSRWDGLTPRDHFCSLWGSIHGADAWDANPWVVAMTFTVHQRNIDALPATMRGTR